MKTVTFWFDVVSPYVWLAFDRLPQALAGISHGRPPRCAGCRAAQCLVGPGRDRARGRGRVSAWVLAGPPAGYDARVAATPPSARWRCSGWRGLCARERAAQLPGEYLFRMRCSGGADPNDPGRPWRSGGRTAAGSRAVGRGERDCGHRPRLHRVAGVFGCRRSSAGAPLGVRMRCCRCCARRCGATLVRRFPSGMRPAASVAGSTAQGRLIMIVHCPEPRQ